MRHIFRLHLVLVENEIITNDDVRDHMGEAGRPAELLQLGEDVGLFARWYRGWGRSAYEGRWFAETNLKPIGTGFPRNNIAYYIEGEASCAKQLKLKLNVNAPDGDGEARALFAQAALYLLLKASNSAPTKRVERKIEALGDFELARAPHTISLKKDDWSRGTRPEYDLVFKIEIKTSDSCQV